MPLSVVEVAYQAIIHTTVNPILVPLIVSKESKEAYLSAWAEKSLHTKDFLDMVFPSDKAILEVMCACDKIYKDLHHRSYFLLELRRIENQEFHVRLASDDDILINPFQGREYLSRGIWKKFLLLFLSASL